MAVNRNMMTFEKFECLHFRKEKFIACGIPVVINNQ